MKLLPCLARQKGTTLRALHAVSATPSKPRPVSLSGDAAPSLSAASASDSASASATLNATHSLLTKMLDDPQFNQSFSTPQTPLNSLIYKVTGTPTGLFNNPYLTTPSGLHTFASTSLAQARSIADQIKAGSASGSLVQITRQLDQLSDVLCRVLDLCGYVRELHPSRAFRHQAQEAHEMMYEYMNELNTDEAIYLALKAALEDPRNVAVWRPEDVAVGEILKSDFENAGLHMPAGEGNTREGFVGLAQQIAVTGQAFQQGVGNLARGHVKLTPDEALRNAAYLGGFGRRLPLLGSTPYQILRSCPDAAVRQKVWLALHTPDEQQQHLLEQLLTYRAILARMMGFDSFAEYNLKMKMAKTPEQVMAFLTAVMEAEGGKVERELRVLGVGLPDTGTAIAPWDLTYLKTQLAVQRPSKQTESHLDYFSVGTVLRGISELFHSIYGIHFRGVPLASGESWHQDVRKIEIVCEDEGVIGIMYLDLFHRPDKNGHPAHYNIVCARQIFEEEFAPTAAGVSAHAPRLMADAHRGQNIVQTIVQPGPAGTSEVYQLPVISLVCDFSKNDPTHSTSLLHQHQIETLFHEFGHAIHSMLGRTIYHCISGTRTPSDFVEVPLILMESFARDPRVLRRIGRHYQTGEPISDAAVRLMVDHGDTFPALDLLATIKLSAIDMALHSDEVLRNGRPRAGFAASIAHRVEHDFGVLADEVSNSQAQCGHLNSYGANYYSYVLGKVAAQRIWDKWFVRDPYARSGGAAVRRHLLKWGGGRDPWRMLADVLEIEALARGDKAAMRLLAGAP